MKEWYRGNEKEGNTLAFVVSQPGDIPPEDVIHKLMARVPAKETEPEMSREVRFEEKEPKRFRNFV